MPELLEDERELVVGVELGLAELVVTTDELLGATDERELGTTLLDEPPTIFGQVERAIQLLLFSQPQPL